MKDLVQIKKNIISVQLSVSVEQIDSSAYIGHIPSFDIPFTSPSKEMAVEIANGLVKALFTKWLKIGGVKYLIEKLEEYKFFKYSLNRTEFEHFVPIKSFQIKQELHVV